MATKKLPEIFTESTAGELKVGDRFREPESTASWQEIVSLEKIPHYEDPEKTIIACKTKIEGVLGEFPYSAFDRVKVEILN